MENEKLRISSLDKDELKQSFINYLRQTSEFQNFNFDASGMASLVNMLSHNAYYHSMMANFLFNESMLDTASKRQNVVSRARELGYTPKTRKSAKARLRVIVRNIAHQPSSLVLPKNTLFNTTVNNDSFSFITSTPYAANRQSDINGVFYQFDIDVYEGVMARNSFALSSTDKSLEIPNLQLDATSLRVFVTVDTTEYEFYPPKNFLTLSATNKAYFLFEGVDNYRLFFGDNTFGYKPPTGSKVIVEYIVTTGAFANGAKVFSMASTIPDAENASVSITTLQIASGGAEREDIESIRLNAANGFAAQDRAVTTNDYKSIILQSSEFVNDVIVWGGESNNPPAYGKVFACVDPRYGDTLTINQQNSIRTLVNSKSVNGTRLEFVDPEYLDILVTCAVTYNVKLLTVSSYELEFKVKDTIATYITNNLTRFNGRLRYSQLVGMIDRCDSSIVSNVTEVKLLKKYVPSFYQAYPIKFTFSNELDNGDLAVCLKSTLFYIEGSNDAVWIEDDHRGSLNMFTTRNGVKTAIQYNIGSLNYKTGDLFIPSLTITGINGLSLNFYASPFEKDIFSRNKLIIRVDSDNINVTTTPDR